MKAAYTGAFAALAAIAAAGCSGGTGGSPACSGTACVGSATTGGTTSGGGTSGSTTGTGGAGSSAASLLAAKLGRGSRLLIGLGGYNDVPDIQSQGLRPDFYDRYLSDVGGSSWVDYNSPPGSYVDAVAAQADSVGALPMYTLYQMAVNGEGNLATLADRNLMTTYWAHAVLAFQRIGAYGRPALVNFEPDFWGFTEQQATNNDPASIFAYVNITPECSTLPNNVAGVGHCLLQIARTYAPKAYVGFPPSAFGNSDAQIVAYMNAVGAAGADFMVMQTLDRDAGCFEAAPSYCQRNASGLY